MKPRDEFALLLVDAIESLNYDPPAPGDVFAVAGARLDLATGTLTTAGFQSDDTGATARAFKLAADLPGAPDVSLNDDTLILGADGFFATSLAATSPAGEAFIAWLSNDKPPPNDQTERLLLRAGEVPGSVSTMQLGPENMFVTVGDPVGANRFVMSATELSTGVLAEFEAEGDGSAYLRTTAVTGTLDATIGVVSADFADFANVSTDAGGITLRTTGTIEVELDSGTAGNLYGTTFGNTEKSGSNYAATTSMAYIGSCQMFLPAFARAGVAVVTIAVDCSVAGATTSIFSTLAVAQPSGGADVLQTAQATLRDQPAGAGATVVQTYHVPTIAGTNTRLRIYASRAAAGSGTVYTGNTTITAVHYC